MHVGLVFNQKSSEESPPPADLDPDGSIASGDAEAEWDSPETIRAVADAISTRHDVTLIEANQDAYEKLRTTRPDIVFNMAEGRSGGSRELQIPAILEMLDIPYTGSDPVTLGICLDKSRTKEVLLARGVATPPFVVCERPCELNGQIKPPAVVKPLWEGSSKGISDDCLAKDYAAIRRKGASIMERYRQPVIIEKFLPGREFTVALLGNGAGVRVLPLIEMDFSVLPAGANPLYSYEAKWTWDVPERPLDLFTCPAKVDARLKAAIEKVVKDAYRVLRCRDWSRIDVRLDERGVPNIIEVNPLPGILPRPEENSCFPKAARAAGLSYTQLVLSVLDNACDRYHLKARGSSS